MRRSTLAICALLTVAIYGCDTVDKVTAKLKLAWDKVRGKPTATQTAPPRPATDTAAARVAAAAQQQQQQQQHPTQRSALPPPPQRPSGGGAPLTRDVPYVSEDTGTIAPGMSEREIYNLWGAAVAVRHAGEYTYLFFNNGCEYTCGTMDVVTLKNGAVVDAVLRWDGHRYSGESSSPPGKMPVPNVGGDTLRVRPP